MAATGRKKSVSADSANERRKSQRFSVNSNSMLCNSGSLAEILDISIGGVACKKVVDSEKSSEILSDVELLNCEIGESVQGLKLKRVRKGEYLKKDGADCFFKFVNLSSLKSGELDRFIKKTRFGKNAVQVVFS